MRPSLCSCRAPQEMAMAIAIGQTAAGTAGAAGLLRKDCTPALRIPYLPEDEPSVPQPDGLALPLYSYQLRNVHRMQVIEGYADGRFRSDFGTWKDYKPRGGVIADSTGLGKTASVIGLLLSEPYDKAAGPTLVVVPTHLAKQWADEVVKFAGGLLSVVQGLHEFEQRELQGDLDNRCIIIVDVNEVLNAKKVWYDFRKVYSCRTYLKHGWSIQKQDQENPDSPPKCYVEQLTGQTLPLARPPLSHSPIHESMTLLKITDAEKEVYMAAARWVTGAYSGWVYTSGLHMPRKRFRRTIFDEVHDLIDTNADGTGSIWQNNLMQTTRCADRVWCMSATPFPKGNRSVYGINQLLGFSRLKLDVELTRSLPYDHTFEVIKRRLYIKNHESVRDEVITSKIKVEHATIQPMFTTIESANYHAIAHQLQRDAGGQVDPFSAAFEELRRICCHPACSEQLAEAFATGSKSGRKQKAPSTIQEFSNMMVRGRQKTLDRLVEERRTMLCSAKLWANAAALGDYLHRYGAFGLLEGDMGDATLRRLVTSETTEPEIYTYNPRCTENQPCAACAAGPTAPCLHITGLAEKLTSTSEIVSYVRDHLDTSEKQRRFQNFCRGKVHGQSTELTRQSQEISSLSRRIDYFASVLKAVQGCSAEGIECPICFEMQTVMTINLECGHHTCTPCMNKVLAMGTRGEVPVCVHCRTVLCPEKLMALNVNRSNPASSSTETELDRQYGAKPAALVTFLRSVLSDSTNKVIVFSMWTSALQKVGETLTKCKIPNVWCQGNRSEKEVAMRLFTVSHDVNVLMLTADASASGANLQVANYVVLLDPPGMHAAQGSALEQQAIARSVRLGQTRKVNITRFIMSGTIEEDLFRQIATQRDSRTEHTAAHYKCEDLSKLLPRSRSTPLHPAAASAIAPISLLQTNVPAPPMASSRKRVVSPKEEIASKRARPETVHCARAAAGSAKVCMGAPASSPGLDDYPVSDKARLLDMGFSAKSVSKALWLSQGSTQKAVDMLLSGFTT